MSRPTKDEWAIGLARLTSTRTTCLRRSVGCVLLSARGHVLATGYNGVAAGMPHCNERAFKTSSMTHDQRLFRTTTYPNACPGADAASGTSLDDCHALHGEQNSLLQCRDVYQIHTAYVTTSPCMTCTKLLLNTSCERIVFDEEYSQGDGPKSLWTKAGRAWEQYHGE